MKKELEKKLQTKYPLIFRDLYGNMVHTCMHWGLECGDGWYDLIDECCRDIMSEGPPDDFRAEQIKEKFGTLRFYVSAATTEIHEHIDKAEDKSRETCEVCGEPGILRSGGWVVTRCDGCVND